MTFRQTLQWFAHRNRGRQARRPKTSRQFELEALQDRTLLSVTFSDLNAASNTYTIDHDLNNPANLEVVENGVKPISAPPANSGTSRSAKRSER